jgi:hypothetical protein
VRPIPDFTVYPDEYERVAKAWAKLEEFEFQWGTEADRKIFEMACHTEMGKAGMQVNVTWRQERHPDGTPSQVFSPQVEICGRTKGESETDHDRMRYGIVKGLADGQPGYVREDGSKTEDPRKKDIL